MRFKDWIDPWSLAGFAVFGVFLGRFMERGEAQDLLWTAIIGVPITWRLYSFLRRRVEQQNKVSAGPDGLFGRLAAIADGEQELTEPLTAVMDEFSRISRQLMYEMDVIALQGSTAEANRQAAARLDVVRRDLSQLERHWRNLLDLHPSHPIA
jgi:hypothetical protein